MAKYSCQLSSYINLNNSLAFYVDLNYLLLIDINTHRPDLFASLVSIGD
jgi:hypothetical protein